MVRVAIIMMIRYPHIDEHGYMESRVDTLNDDSDGTMIRWIRKTISNFLDSEDLDFDNYDQFMEDYYPHDSDEAPPPFRVSYFDMKYYKWRYLEDDFMDEILYNWDTPNEIDMNKEDSEDIEYYDY